MKPSHAVKIILSLAAHEAGSGTIDIEHFLIGLLQFAGLSEKELTLLADRMERRDSLRSDRDELARKLHGAGVQVPETSRRIYRELLSILKDSGNGPAGAPGHRSEALKMRFAAAETAAKKKGREAVTPVFLLAAILEVQTAAVKIAFQNQNIHMALFGHDLSAPYHGTGIHPVKAPSPGRDTPLSPTTPCSWSWNANSKTEKGKIFSL